MKGLRIAEAFHFVLKRLDELLAGLWLCGCGLRHWGAGNRQRYGCRALREMQQSPRSDSENERCERSAGERDTSGSRDLACLNR